MTGMPRLVTCVYIMVVFEVAVTEECLDATDVSPGFEEVRCEGVA